MLTIVVNMLTPLTPLYVGVVDKEEMNKGAPTIKVVEYKIYLNVAHILYISCYFLKSKAVQLLLSFLLGRE